MAVLTPITRRSCLARIAAIPLRSYEYSQTRLSPKTGKRADCSGWVSYVLATPDEPPQIPGVYLNAYNTRSFVTEHVLERIKWSQLLPGDQIGYCSPTSPGNGGHIAIWLGGDRFPTGEFHVRDHGSGLGPKDRWVKWYGDPNSWLAPTRPDGSPGLAPYRYVAVIEDEIPGGDMLLVRVKATGAIYSTTGTHYHHLTPQTYPVALAAWHKTTWDYEVPAETDMAAFGVEVSAPPPPPGH